MYNDIIYLITKNETDQLDEYGDKVFTETTREVFAEVLSVGMNEFYQAMTAGVNPEIKFEIADFYDYNGEKELIYNNIRYKILRTYRKDIPLEIVCYGGVHIEHSEISN